MEKEQAKAQNKLEKAVAGTKMLNRVACSESERREPGGPVRRRLP